MNPLNGTNLSGTPQESPNPKTSSPSIHPPQRRKKNRDLHRSISLSTLLHCSFMLLVLSMPPLMSKLEPIHPKTHVHLVLSIPTPPVIHASHASPPLDPQSEDIQGDSHDQEIASRAKGTEGSVGSNKEAPQTRTRRHSTTRAKSKPKKTLHTSDIKSVGILGVLGAQGGVELGEMMTKEDPIKALGELRDAQVGQSRSQDRGLGSLGTGRAGGGVNKEESLGISLDTNTAWMKLGGQGLALHKQGKKRSDLQVTHQKKYSSCLSRKMIQDAVARRHNQARFCYEQHLQRHAKAKGEVTLSLEVNASGTLTKLDVTGHTFASNDVATCIKRSLSSLRFPSFKGCKSVRATYPFRFRPQTRP